MLLSFNVDVQNSQSQRKCCRMGIQCNSFWTQTVLPALCHPHTMSSSASHPSQGPCGTKLCSPWDSWRSILWHFPVRWVSHSGTSSSLQHIPAECGLMGQAWHRKVSGGVIRVCWQAASSAGAVLHSLFSTGLKGKPLFALSLYRQREAAGAFLPLPRPLLNSWLEILIWALAMICCCDCGFKTGSQDYSKLMDLHGVDWWYCCLLCLDFPRVKMQSLSAFWGGGLNAGNKRKPQNLNPWEGIAEQAQSVPCTHTKDCRSVLQQASAACEIRSSS